MRPKGLTIAKTVAKVSVVTTRRAGRRVWHAEQQGGSSLRGAPDTASFSGAMEQCVRF